MSVRFAPSPTGPFHVGNLRTAWISYRWARHLGLPWVVRFEDIDKPRVVTGAREKQLEDMGALGLKADQILLQSDFHDRHRRVFQKAVAAGAVYPCFCSRKEVLRDLASAPHGTSPVYTGRCRNLRDWPEAWPGRTEVAWRFKAVPQDPTQDFIVGRTPHPAAKDRAPADPALFVPSYQWACAIDDFDGQHTLLVRAYDLEDSAAQQRAIQAWLAGQEGQAARLPAIFHTALVVTNEGTRLEKRTKGVTLDELVAAGVSTEILTQFFAESFDIEDYLFAPAKLFGEVTKQITLSRLNLRYQIS